MYVPHEIKAIVENPKTENEKLIAKFLVPYINGSIISHEWSIEDVKDIAKESNIEISDQDCRKVLSEIFNNLDSELGITWDTIKSEIENY